MYLIKNHHDLEKALHSVSSLQHKQREQVYGAFAQELDDGGITSEEYDKVLRHLHESRGSYGLSDTDFSELRQLKERLEQEM